MAPRFVMFLIFIASLISLTGGDNEASVKILVVGKTGSGKSTLVNGLFGSEKATVGNGLEAQTKDVECFWDVYHSESEKDQTFRVTICDSPGFRDFSYNDEEYIKMLQLKCNNPDLVLFVVSMEVKRWTTDEAETVALVNKALGEEVWKNTLLVLTFANKVNDAKIKDEFLKKFVQSLDKMGIKRDGMPVALAGHLLESEGEHLPKHGIKYWYTELLIEGLKRVRRKGLDALMLLIFKNKEKIKLTNKNKAILCDIFNNKASKAVLATVIFATVMAVSPFGWLVTSFISTAASAAGYSMSITTLDEFCSEPELRDEL